MNYRQWIGELKISEKLLDCKKPQTNYKIKYVVEYIKRWILVSVNREMVTNVNFVDCMCNAGIYEDGDLCTAMEVLSLFITAAQQHPDKNFNLFVNDVKQDRIEACKQITKRLLNNQVISNLNICFDNKDVNEYLNNFSLFDKKFGYGASTVLFVDPYNFGTVKIDRLTAFINRYYCEVIFNFFISDYERNGIDDRIRECIGNAKIENKDELITYIVKEVKVGKMKYVFSYQFRTRTNKELYHIIFITPSKKGLEKLKEALWSTFNGKFCYRNTNISPRQLSLISEDEDRELLLSMHAKDAISLLLNQFHGQTVNYQEIESFLDENTMIQASDFLVSVIKPLIKQNKIGKCGIPKNKNNYKNDEYIIYEE
jgi:three-Cys-motif partner protein